MKKTLTLIGLVLFVLITLVAVLKSDSEAVVTLVGMVIYYSVGIVFPFAYVVITGNYLKGVLYCWVIGGLCLLFLSTVFPAVLMSVKPESSDIIARAFPRPHAVVPMLLLGWIVGFFWCGIAYGLRVVYLYLKNKKAG